MAVLRVADCAVPEIRVEEAVRLEHAKERFAHPSASVTPR
jgi:hypothetical protein